MSELSPEQWMIVRDRLAAICGLYLDESRQNQGRAIILKRLKQLNLETDEYIALVRSKGDRARNELREVAQQVANHETQFFRNPAHFRALRTQVFPELHRLRSPLHMLRCWSAGCSTGEEPYSLAIAALEAFGYPPERAIRINATDISAAAIAQGRAGCYRGRAVANVNSIQRRWFEEQEDQLQVGTALRSLVQFEQHNLLDPFPPWATELDVVFCQNVTIYFQLATCQRLIERLYAAMSVGSYLFLGFSESLWGIFDGFETIECGGAFLYRKPAHVQLSRHTLSRQPAISNRQPAHPPLRSETFERPTTARPARSAALPTANQSATTILNRVRALRANGEQRAALTLLESIAASEISASILALTAQLHADLGQTEQAAAEALRALELDVMQDGAYLVLGMLELQNGAWEQATRHLERALYLVPESPAVSFYLAESYRYQGRSENAIREYRNTMRKLQGVAPTTLIDGVAAQWLLASCQRWLQMLESGQPA